MNRETLEAILREWENELRWMKREFLPGVGYAQGRKAGIERCLFQLKGHLRETDRREKARKWKR